MASDTRPGGKLTAGAIGNFLLGTAAALFVLTLGAAMFGGATPSESGAGIIGLVVFVFIIAGGICAALGWFGLGSLYGGTNVLAGIFSIVLALVPILTIVLAMGAVSSARSGGMTASSAASTGMIGIILGLGVPALLAIFGGLGIMGAKTGLAKPAGLLMLLGGIGCAALAVFAIAGISNPTLASIALYVGFFGLAIGFFMSGATMIAERKAS